jgi:hypothetical protein
MLPGGPHIATRRWMLRFACTSAVVLTCASCSSQSQSAAPVAAVAISAAADATDGHSTGAHGDHVPRHGGIVFMNGDLHFEVVLSRSGTHQLYFSDETRAELPAATASEVTLSFSSGEAPAETLRAQVDDSGESWIAKGPPLKGKDVTARVSFVVENEPYWIDVPYVEGLERAGP